MRLMIGSMVFVSVLAAATLSGSSAKAADKTPAKDKAVAQQQSAQVPVKDKVTAQQQETWRYTYHNGEWWYWLPSNRWVYWRNSQWNDYDPRTFTYAGVLTGDSRVATSGARAAADPENRPFYGHALSGLDRRPLEANNEAGPFYGHALPSEFFGSWRSRRANRPFYGHAVSSYDD